MIGDKSNLLLTPRSHSKRKALSFAIAVLTIVIVIGVIIYYIVDSYSSSSSNASPYVKTHLGGIKGYYKTSFEGRLYELYEGIPYALPPTGERRFEPPVRIPPWSNDIEAVTLPPACAQSALAVTYEHGQEDCLYLNIYVPVKRNASLPILFWIHSGALMIGSSIGYDAKFLMDKDLIVVTHNYRLGALGFLSTGDEIVPGNAGLKDQNMALRWVSDNIHYFGGDPKKVTLAGDSSGAACVHLHYLSPMSAGLFRSGISFSASALDPWAYVNNSSALTKSFASALGCPIKDSAMMINCLKKVPVNKILNETQNMQGKATYAYPLFSPVAESTESDYFINDSPAELISKGKVYDAPWVVGNVKDEGLIFALEFMLNKEKVAYFNDHWEEMFPLSRSNRYIVPESKNRILAYLSKEHYLGDQRFSSDKDVITRVSHLVGDALFVVGNVKAAKLQASVNKSPVWFYYYTYEAPQSLSVIIVNSTEYFGVSHGDDVHLLFMNKGVNTIATLEDINMVKAMRDFWYSVIDKGAPDLGVNWPALNGSSKDFQYMHIAGPQNYSMEINNDFGGIEFWTSIGL